MLKFRTFWRNFIQKYFVNKFNELKWLGERIRYYRIKRGLSQAKLGLKIFKDQQSIHKVEKGQFNPTYIYLLEICEGLEISIEILLKKED